MRSVPYSHLRCTAQINGIINSDVSKSYPEFMRSGTRNAGRATDSDPARGLFPSVNELPHREAGDVECSPTNRPTVSADRPEICPTVHAPVPPSRIRTGCGTRILATDTDSTERRPFTRAVFDIVSTAGTERISTADRSASTTGRLDACC